MLTRRRCCRSYLRANTECGRAWYVGYLIYAIEAACIRVSEDRLTRKTSRLSEALLADGEHPVTAAQDGFALRERRVREAEAWTEVVVVLLPVRRPEAVRAELYELTRIQIENTAAVLTLAPVERSVPAQPEIQMSACG